MPAGLASRAGGRAGDPSPRTPLARVWRLLTGDGGKTRGTGPETVSLLLARGLVWFRLRRQFDLYWRRTEFPQWYLSSYSTERALPDVLRALPVAVIELMVAACGMIHLLASSRRWAAPPITGPLLRRLPQHLAVLVEQD